ncbi:MAG TPA: SIMPL domain-containing protein [Longimicrobiaceae bacterium]|nr:SIMPL domain-containing protein [Longimicrobiaceae bacterium]
MKSSSVLNRFMIAPALLAMTAFATPAAAQGPGMMMEHHPPRSIDVTGSGEVQAEPDLANLRFAVETLAPTAQEAAAENAERMDQVIRALVDAGVPRADIETENYTVYPEYVHDPDAEEPRLRGYRVRNQISLETGDLDRVGSLIDVALTAGANRVEGVSFSLEDAAAAQAEALRRAVASARSTAETIAAALGVPLGEVINASTSTEIVQPVMYRRVAQMEMADASAAPTPIEPEEQTIRAVVSVSFAIGGTD